MSDSATHKTTVGIVVLNWEEFSATKECIASLLRLEVIDNIRIKIVVCDNDSQDHSAQALMAWVAELGSSSVKFLATGKNGGYAYGNNRGIEYLLKHCSPHYIWILNNDVEVCASSLRYLLEAATGDPDVLIWGSTLVDHADRNTIECGGGYRYFPATGRIKGNFSGISVNLLDEYATYQGGFDYLSGAALFCRAKVFKEFGLLSEDYFLYFEEYDFIKRIGGQEKIGWCVRSLVYHVCGLSILGSSRKRRSSVQQYYENLNTLKFTYRFYKGYLLNILLLRLIMKPVLFAVRREWHLYGPFFYALKGFYRWIRKGAPESPQSQPAQVPNKTYK